MSYVIDGRSHDPMDREIADIVESAVESLRDSVNEGARPLDELFALVVLQKDQLVTFVGGVEVKDAMVDSLRKKFYEHDPKFFETLSGCLALVDSVKADGMLRSVVAYETPRHTAGFARVRVQLFEGAHA